MLRLRLIPYNARLVDARRERGWTQKDLSMLTGLHTSMIGHIETLRIIPKEEYMDEIASAFDIPKDFLFPEALIEAMHSGLLDHRVTELKEAQIVRLSDTHSQRLLPEGKIGEAIASADQLLLGECIKDSLNLLPPKERLVITLRFGLDGKGSRTLRQIGDELGVIPERVRQIEAKALRELRHPQISKRLKDFLD